MRLIDADALIARCGSWYTEEGTEEGFIGILKNVVDMMPTIEPERKTGRWIYGEDNLRSGVDGWFCSKCGHFEMWDYSADMKSAELNLPNFCPNCGAAMIEEGGA